MPQDDPRLPRLLPATPSPKELALLKSQLPSLEQLSPAVKDQLKLQASLMPPARWPSPAAVESSGRGLIEQRQALTALERERAARLREIAAIELEIAGRRETVRTLEEWLARAGGTSNPPGETSPPAKPPAPASAKPNPPATVPAAPDPDEIGHPAPDEEQQDGPQAELTRLFFQEVYPGGPPKKMGYRRLRERMEDWVVEKNTLDHGSRVAASETTIRRVRNAL